MVVRIHPEARNDDTTNRETVVRIIGEPGHWKPGADTNHFLGLCDECDAHYLTTVSADGADDWYRQGILGQDMFEAFMHAWVTSAYRYGYDGWKSPPTDPTVIELVELIREAHRSRM